MGISKAEQTQIENEMIFRRINEKVGSDLDAIDAKHAENGNAHLIRDDDFLLLFKCECSDENCEVRIPLKLSKYKKIHLNRDCFIVRKHHQVNEIEEIIVREKAYKVVMKNNSTAEPSDVLNDTVIDNSR